jgi:hypothetical protein
VKVIGESLSTVGILGEKCWLWAMMGRWYGLLHLEAGAMAECLWALFLYEWFLMTLCVVFGFAQSVGQASFEKHSHLLASFWKSFFQL